LTAERFVVPAAGSRRRRGHACRSRAFDGHLARRRAADERNRRADPPRAPPSRRGAPAGPSWSKPCVWGAIPDVPARARLRERRDRASDARRGCRCGCTPRMHATSGSPRSTPRNTRGPVKSQAQNARRERLESW